ncbi:MAG: hypothetical protein WB630_08195 [Candidatus Acidiferrales bacterium]
MGGNQWLELYQNAVLEVNRNKLQERIKLAEDAINQRAATFNGQVFRDERMAMQDALAALRLLKREWEQNAVDESSRRTAV